MPQAAYDTSRGAAEEASCIEEKKRKRNRHPFAPLFYPAIRAVVVGSRDKKDRWMR